MAIAVPTGGKISKMFNRLELMMFIKRNLVSYYPSPVELLVTKLEDPEFIKLR